MTSPYAFFVPEGEAAFVLERWEAGCSGLGDASTSFDDTRVMREMVGFANRGFYVRLVRRDGEFWYTRNRDYPTRLRTLHAGKRSTHEEREVLRGVGPRPKMVTVELFDPHDLAHAVLLDEISRGDTVKVEG